MYYYIILSVFKGGHCKFLSKFSAFLLLQQIKSIVDAGVNCIVTGGKVAEMALHFCNKFNILVVR